MTDTNDSQKALDAAIGEYIKHAAPYAHVADFELGWKRCSEWQSQQAPGEATADLFRCSKCGAEARVNHDGPELTCNTNGCFGAAYRVNPAPAAVPEPSFQRRVRPWLLECFGEQIANDAVERNQRFLEEALELVQSCGCTKDEAQQLVEYVYGRPAGAIHQEVGGVMVTLAALCLAQSLCMHECGDIELERVWGKVDQIREKQKRKPAMSPLPGVYPDRKPAPVAVPKPEQVAALEAFIDRFIDSAESVTKVRAATSYSDSYFGEKPGAFKESLSELDHTICAYRAYQRGDYNPL